MLHRKWNACSLGSIRVAGRGAIGPRVARVAGKPVPDPDFADPARGPLKTKLREWRIRAGLLTEDVATRSGITFTEISGMQNGVLCPTREQLRALCKALDCRPRDLYPCPDVQPLAYIGDLERELRRAS
jgi:DNA-binding Xre family transcriptional regulator